MSNIQACAESMTNDLYNVGLVAGKIGRLLTNSYKTVIDSDSFEIGDVGDLCLATLRRLHANDITAEN